MGDKVIKIAPYKYGYHLDEMLKETVGLKTIIYMDGKKHFIENSQVEFNSEKQLTIDEFNERVRGTKGIYKTWGNFREFEIKEDDSKYYTPSIEEFYVGFEYERLYIDEWLSDAPFPEMAGDHAIENTEFLLDEGLIRVKYLDKEDIEELGFHHWATNHNPKGELVGYELSNERFNITFILKDSFLEIVETITYKPYFEGYIKNKSELKKILQQIGIRTEDNKE